VFPFRWRYSEAEVRSLIDQGYAALEEGDLRRAKRCASALHRAGNSGGYAIQARVEWARGQHDAAMATLQEGVRKVPQDFVLWDFLGEYLSNRERYEEAVRAFDASRRAGGDPLVAEFNLALVRQREGRLNDALNILDALDASQASPSQLISLGDLRIFVLNRLDRFEEALAAYETLPPTEDAPLNVRARLLAERAYALFKARDARAEAWEMARKALDLNRENDSALWVLREIRGMRSRRAQRIRVTIQAPAPEMGGIPFTSHFMIVADTLVQALQFVQEIEMEEIHDELRIVEYKFEGPAGDEPLGIYGATARLIAKKDYRRSTRSQ
jgi:tetratricopeptide (TPR) repeat protein